MPRRTRTWVGRPLVVDLKVDEYVAGDLGLARFFGELGFGREEDDRRGDAAADAPQAAAHVAAGARAESVAVAGAEAAARFRCPCSCRRAGELGMPKLGTSDLAILMFGSTSTVTGGVRFRVVDRRLGRVELFGCELGRVALGDRAWALLASAAAHEYWLGRELGRGRGWRIDQADSYVPWWG